MQHKHHLAQLLGVIATAVAMLGVGGVGTGYAASLGTGATQSATHTFLGSLGHVSQIGSTVPKNGDVNPYGVAVLRQTTGRLVRGDVLVSNFNDAANVQGTGRTLVEISPHGAQTLFARITKLPTGQRCPGGVGLSTALAVLPGGWVIVGSSPAAGPSGFPARANPSGCLVVLNKDGVVVETWSSGAINGPWDLTASVTGSSASIFVANALSRPASMKSLPTSGLCTVTRIDVTLGSGVPKMTGSTVIGKGFAWRINHDTFVLAPTGLALSPTGTLYVVQTLGNHVTAIANALTRSTAVTDGTSTLTRGGALNSPLGAVMAPNGDLIVTNGGSGRAVEVTPQGRQVASANLVANGAGALFGVAISLTGKGLVFVNDSTNALDTDT